MLEFIISVLNGYGIFVETIVLPAFACIIAFLFVLHAAGTAYYYAIGKSFDDFETQEVNAFEGGIKDFFAYTRVFIRPFEYRCPTKYLMMALAGFTYLFIMIFFPVVVLAAIIILSLYRIRQRNIRVNKAVSVLRGEEDYA